MDKLLTPKEVALLLSINYRKVLDMIALGDMGAYQIGGVYRIPKHEIHKYLDSVKVKSVWKK
jgi:excisionase family DNA binding protein